MKYTKIAWYVFTQLIYLTIVVAVLSVATTRFETVALASLVELYATVLFDHSVLGVSADVNNHAAFYRFRILAAAVGVTENEDGTFLEQQKALQEQISSYRTKVRIGHVANALVSIYAIFKIVQAVLFS